MSTGCKEKLDHVICVKTSSWRSQLSLASFGVGKRLVTVVGGDCCGRLDARTKLDHGMCGKTR